MVTKMSKFNVGDKIKLIKTGETGQITMVQIRGKDNIRYEVSIKNSKGHLLKTAIVTEDAIDDGVKEPKQKKS